MDSCKERRTKSDKAKEKFERNGKYSSQYVRAVEALAEKRVASNAQAKSAK